MLVHRARDERGVRGGAATAATAQTRMQLRISVVAVYFAWLVLAAAQYNVSSLKYGLASVWSRSVAVSLTR